MHKQLSPALLHGLSKHIIRIRYAQLSRHLVKLFYFGAPKTYKYEMISATHHQVMRTHKAWTIMTSHTGPVTNLLPKIVSQIVIGPCVLWIVFHCLLKVILSLRSTQQCAQVVMAACVIRCKAAVFIMW